MPAGGGEARRVTRTDQRESQPAVPPQRRLCSSSSGAAGRRDRGSCASPAPRARRRRCWRRTSRSAGSRCRATGAGSPTWSGGSPMRRRARPSSDLFVQPLARRKRPGHSDAPSRRARAEPVVLSVAPTPETMKALTLTGIGGLDRLAAAGGPGSGDPAPRRGAGPGPLRGAQSARSLDDRRPAQRQAVVPARGGLRRRGRGRGGGRRRCGRWRPGDRVLINPGLSCGHCAACEEGEESLCSSFGILGEHLPGTAAELVVVPAANLGRGARGHVVVRGGGVHPRDPDRLADADRPRQAAGRRDGADLGRRRRRVGMAALQIAVLLGARAIVTSGSDAKLETARAARRGAAA